jgi:negative regulator of sigma E activity
MIQETLSALHDGECSDRELDALLDALERRPELKAGWSRMQIAREAWHSVRVSRIDICAAVMAGLDADPKAARPKVVALASRRRPKPWRAAAGLAIAASVAALAVTLGINFGSVGSSAVLGTAANDSPTAAPRASAIRDVALVSGADEAAGAVPAAQMDDDLRNYMIEHSNSLADRGLGGALSYARFAAHTDEADFVQQSNLAVGGTP